MKSILVTGAAGFLGSTVSQYFKDKGYEVYSLTRQDLDISDQDQVENWFSNNKVDVVVHTATKGGRRNEHDSYENFVTNLKMFNNLIGQKSKFSLMINFGSGAEFDRRNNIDNFKEGQVFDYLPEDFYGLSKNMITRKIIKHNTNVYSFRLFGCFGKDEKEDRLLKILYSGIKDQKQVFIETEKEMDFFYDIDVCRAIEFYINNHQSSELPRDVNLVYDRKRNLKEISTLLEKTILQVNKNLTLNNFETKHYTGNWELCSKTFPSDLFAGFEIGVKNIYGGS
tara:strand:- start:1241 stop:2086 length:846 start_codon:yes stop_codon:yes gene_type:complete